MVSMYVCVHACMYVRNSSYLCVYTRTYACMYVRMYIRVCMYYTYVCIPVCQYVFCKHAQVETYTDGQTDSLMDTGPDR